MVEAGAPEFNFHLVDKVEVWADDAARIYAQAVAAQWDPETADSVERRFQPAGRRRRRRRPDHDVSDRERNRRADCAEPLHRPASPAFPRGDAGARGAGRGRGPSHRRVHTAGAAQAGSAGPVDGWWTGVTQDARRRARFCDCVISPLGARAKGRFSPCSGSSSGTHPIRSRLRSRRLAAQDEAQTRGVRSRSPHPAHLSGDTGLRPRLASAIRRRHEALRHTAGLNAEVFDALLLIAAGSWDHADLREGHRRVMQLTQEMDEGRRKRLVRLGFSDQDAEELSALHTRNFM